MRRLLNQRQAQKERCVFTNTDIISTVIRGGEGSDSLNLTTQSRHDIAIGGHITSGRLHPSDGSLELCVLI